MSQRITIPRTHHHVPSFEAELKSNTDLQNASPALTKLCFRVHRLLYFGVHTPFNFAPTTTGAPSLSKTFYGERSKTAAASTHGHALQKQRWILSLAHLQVALGLGAGIINARLNIALSVLGTTLGVISCGVDIALGILGCSLQVVTSLVSLLLTATPKHDDVRKVKMHRPF
jgi:hypothetical protein